jgi:hypothetical protein
VHLAIKATATYFHFRIFSFSILSNDQNVDVLVLGFDVVQGFASQNVSEQVQSLNESDIY